MTIVEFRAILSNRFSELGDPSQPVESSCCPLGLVYEDPNDLSPEPVNVAKKTGLPLRFCEGVAGGWDNAFSFYGTRGGEHGRLEYLTGFGEGRKARRRWFLEHPRVFPNDSPSK